MTLQIVFLKLKTQKVINTNYKMFKYTLFYVNIKKFNIKLYFTLKIIIINRL